MATAKPIKITVTVLSGQRSIVDVEPGHTAQDVIGALILMGKLPGEDSAGNPLEFKLVNEGTSSIVPGDQSLIDAGVKDGDELRVKPGARVASRGGH